MVSLCENNYKHSAIATLKKRGKILYEPEIRDFPLRLLLFITSEDIHIMSHQHLKNMMRVSQM